MRVSLNIIQQYTDVDVSVDELVVKINQQLGKVEEVIDLSPRYADAVIARVVECTKHENADKLNVCQIDVGRNDTVQVVCGAPNVRAGLFVVWLPPGSMVPSTADDTEPFVLEARELRGVVSNGMLASAKELAIGDGHDGIVELTDADLPGRDQTLSAGMSFAETFGLNDTIIDIENKMFTHRPDLFGQLGVAREIAGIQHKSFTSPDWYKVLPEFNSGEGLELRVENDASDVVPRFMAVAIQGVHVHASPFWLQCELVRLGGKPINNIVDVTNYIMLLTAQPTHAYDYDKLRGHTLGTRRANSGEKLPLLNGKTYELDESDIVIVDGEGPVGLAGIMGGANSEVSNDTTNLVLEVANFDMYAVRKSSMRHGVFTDALTRFNKGQSSLQNPYVINLLMMSIFDAAGGQQASQVFDAGIDLLAPAAVDATTDFIGSRLGIVLGEEVSTLLTNVEFGVHGRDGEYQFTPPYWRTDIALPEDIVEEVGRLYGFDRLPRELPKRTIIPAVQNPTIVAKQQVRETLSRAGANEVLTYSFVHENILKKVGQDSSHAFRLSNALSPDLQYYRLSIMSSLLDKVHMNARAGHDQFALFEIGKVHYKGEMDANEPNVPNEDNHTALVIAYGDKRRPAGAAYYQARAYLEQITDTDAISLVPARDFDLSTDEWGAQLVSAYDLERSALIVMNDTIYGVVGEFKPSVKKAFKLPGYIAGFELHMDALISRTEAYKPLSKYPSITQDVSLIVPVETPFEQVFKRSRQTIDTNAPESSDVSLSVVSIYQGDDVSKKTITLRLAITSHQATLREADVTTILDIVAAHNYEAS